MRASNDDIWAVYHMEIRAPHGESVRQVGMGYAASELLDVRSAMATTAELRA
jgi:hypothetical protein